MASTSSSFQSVMSFLPDTPALDDVLDYTAYCDALVSIIDGLDKKTSLTIAVFGDWGSGKTTLLGMVRDEVKTKSISTIWVNVWQFGNEEDVWTAFLQSILMKVKKEMSWHRRFLFNLGLLGRQIDLDEVKRKIPEVIIRVLVVLIPTLSSLLIANQPAKLAGTVLSVVLGWFLLLQPYVQVVRERVKVDLKNLIKSSQIRRRVSLLDQFKTYFEDMISSLVGRNGRLVIFVDDLDRCQPDRIVQVLDAIKLFLDIPGCVYLIGLDRKIVEQAIQVKFKDYQRPDRQAREYLEKIIGLPFDLPPLSGEQMEILVNSFHSDLPELKRFAQVFALGQEPNPRKVKRTINMFLLLWELAQRRPQLRNTIKPIRLAKLVVIQHSHRDFYVVLTASPSGLGELEVFLRESKSDDVSSLPDYLKPFASDQNLGRLLTLSPAEGGDDENFTVLQEGKLTPLSEDEIRDYIRLARSVTHDKPAIISSFIGRQKEIDAFMKILAGDTKHRIVMVSGPGGVGKSALLVRYRQICADQRVPVIRLDPTIAGDEPVTFEEQIKAGIEREELSRASGHWTKEMSSDTTAFLRQLVEHTLITKPVIMIDNYERATGPQKDWLNNFLNWIVGSKLASLALPLIVISGRELPSDIASSDSVLHLQLQTFSRADTEEYLRQLGVDASVEVGNQLYEVSKGNPVMIATLAETLKATESPSNKRQWL